MRSFDWENIYCASAAGLAVALAQISTTPVQAADYDIGSIHITEPWARATPKGASSGAAYMTIRNNGTTPDRSAAVERCQRAMANSHHDHGKRRDEDAARGRAASKSSRAKRSCSSLPVSTSCW